MQRISLLYPKIIYCVVVDGNWGEWKDWASCNVTCGRGTKTRRRMCDDPSPKGGTHCNADGSQGEESTNCADEECPATTTPTTKTTRESTTPAKTQTELTTLTATSNPIAAGLYINLTFVHHMQNIKYN